MIKLHNYTITRLDAYNLTWASYKEIDTSKGRQPKDTSKKRDVIKWIESRKYYGTLNDCLLGIKNDIMMQLANGTYNNSNELIQDIEQVQRAIDNLSIKINYEGTRADATPKDKE